MKKIKVLFVLDCLKLGGAQRAIINILNHLNPDKFSCSLVVIKKEGSLQNNIPRSTYLYDLNARSAKYALFKLRRIIKKSNPDVVFSTLTYVNELVYLSNKLLLNPPPVIMRGATVESINLHNEPLIVRYLFKKAYAAAVGVIVLTEAMKNDFVTNFNLEEKKIKVLPNMIDIDYVEKKAKEPLTVKSLRDKQGEPIIVSVGRFTREKGHDILLKAFAKYRARHSKGFLVLVGSGPLEDELKNLAHHLGINRDVLFAGNKANPYKYIKNSDIFILPSRREGFPNVILEAMACGTPVISANCSSGPSEIITPGLDGLLVEPENISRMSGAIDKLISDRGLRQNLAENGLKTAEKYSAKNIISAYAKMIKDTYNGPIKK